MIISYLKEFLRPVRLLMLYRHFKQTHRYKNNKLHLGYYSTLINVILDKNIFIGSNCNIRNSRFDSHSYCNAYCNIQNTSIGKYTSIGSNVNICIGGHPTDLVTTHPAFYSNNKAFETYSDATYFDEYKKSKIGNDVWIGSNSTILNSVTVGDGAIIAYGAIVTKDVPPYSIVGGIPAKHIKYRFKEETIKRLLEIKWWELKDSFLKQHFKLFHNPDEFIKYYDNNIPYVEQFRQM